MANSGSVIDLNSVEMTYDRGSGNDVGPSIGRYYGDFTTAVAPNVINIASVENPKITISGVLDRTNTSDMDLIKELDKLVTTKGIKLLYYSSTSDGYRDITDSLGSNDAFHLSNLTPHLHIRIKSFSIRHTAQTSFLRYTLTCEVTA